MSVKILEFMVGPGANYVWSPAPGDEVVDPVRKKSLVEVSAYNETKAAIQKVEVWRRNDMTIAVTGGAWCLWRHENGMFEKSKGLNEFSGGRGIVK